MSTSLINSILTGAIVFAGCTIALCFWRSWKKTRDRLFIFFAAAFLLLGIERLCLGLSLTHDESYFYLIRLLAFLLIIYAIVDKNRKNKNL
jgi:hypothetical protein